MRIKQVLFSEQVKFFAPEFKRLWQLEDYHDPEAPAVFIGVYRDEEIQKVKQHSGERFISFTGTGSAVNAFSPGEATIINDYASCKHLDVPRNLWPKKSRVLAMKSFSHFRPCLQGNKIYCYLGHGNESCKEKYRYETIEQLIEEFGRDKFLLGHQGHTIDFVIEHYYQKSFVNLQLNPMAGFTTALEMAHMGRNSISNYPAPFCLEFKNTAEIIALIKQEEKKHAFKLMDTSNYAREFLDYSDKWLNTDYWK